MDNERQENTGSGTKPNQTSHDETGQQGTRNANEGNQTSQDSKQTNTEPDHTERIDQAAALEDEEFNYVSGFSHQNFGYRTSREYYNANKKISEMGDKIDKLEPQESDFWEFHDPEYDSQGRF